MSETSPSIGKKSLVAKLCEAGAAIGWIEKSGRNAFHDYAYATEADLVARLRGELYSRNVFVFPCVLQQERKQITVSSKNGQRETALTDVMIRWTFVDGETGEKFECDVPGCGEDSGDKGIYKAMTGSEKYLLMKAFLIPTGDDPEKDGPEDKRDAFQNGKEAAQSVAAQKIAAHNAKVGVTGHVTEAHKFTVTTTGAADGKTVVSSAAQSAAGEGGAENSKGLGTAPLKIVFFENRGEWTYLTGDGLGTLLHFLGLPAEEGGIYQFKDKFMAYDKDDMGFPTDWRVKTNKAELLAEAAVSYGVDAKQAPQGPQIVPNSVPGASGEGLANAVSPKAAPATPSITRASYQRTESAQSTTDGISDLPIIEAVRKVTEGVTTPVMWVKLGTSEYGCFHKSMWPHLEAGIGQTAELDLSNPVKRNGKTYQNIVGIRKIGETTFTESVPDLQQRLR